MNGNQEEGIFLKWIRSFLLKNVELLRATAQSIQLKHFQICDIFCIKSFCFNVKLIYIRPQYKSRDSLLFISLITTVMQSLSISDSGLLNWQSKPSELERV